MVFLWNLVSNKICDPCCAMQRRSKQNTYVGATCGRPLKQGG